jgi:ribonuclease VapC
VLLDSSALVTLLIGEPEARSVFRAVKQASHASVGAPSLVEVCMVLDGRRTAGAPDASSDLVLFMTRLDIEVVAFEPHHWPIAWSAFLRYGKGRHPAGLDFGDCLTYALAKLSGEPLLCVGDDFSQTDLELVPLAP